MTRTILFFVTILSPFIVTAQNPGLKPCFARQVLETRFDTVRSRGVADNYFLWDNGGTITVKFFSGSAFLKKIVREAAAEWEQHANVHFKFVETGEAHIRIEMRDEGNNSMIGLQALQVPQDRSTTLLDTSLYGYGQPSYIKAFRMYALHELGHVLGLLHEHKHPANTIKWNREYIYQEYLKSCGWSGCTDPDPADYLEKYTASYANGTNYDASSIMHYPVMAKWTTDGQSVPWNYELSEGDKQLISLLYPKNTERMNEVLRMTTSFTGIQFTNDTVNKRYRFQPLMKINANIQDKLVLVMYFVDKNGYFIEDDNDAYNVNGAVGSYKAFFTKKGTTDTEDPSFELSFPYNELPLQKSSGPLQVYIVLYHLDKDQEYRKLYTLPEPYELKGL